ncbi:P-loop containing nucleoside triphosphate hydrolase protein, partial [Jimgerdemannia flammicorona]
MPITNISTTTFLRKRQRADANENADTAQDLENVPPSIPTRCRTSQLERKIQPRIIDESAKRLKVDSTDLHIDKGFHSHTATIPSKQNQLERSQSISKTPRVLSEIPLNQSITVNQPESAFNLKARTTGSVYQEAKSVFRRTATPARLVGRTLERAAINSFWEKHVLGNKPGSLYISGSPGTGKTAMLMDIMRSVAPERVGKPRRKHSVKVMMINCMSLTDPKAIYTKMLAELKGEKLVTEKDVVKQAEDIMLSGKSDIMHVVILDEIDHLLTKDQDVLYKIFEWPTVPSARLTLIGIANALDMTDRFLPRLRAKNCEPQLLNFNPYQVTEIVEIILDRLCSLRQDHTDFPGIPSPKLSAMMRQAPLMQTQAIELCARKVAAATGDLRKALDVCRQAIEMVESEAKRQQTAQERSPNPLSDIPKSSPLFQERDTIGVNAKKTLHSMSRLHMELDEAPKVTITHVLKVLTSVFGSPTVQKIKELNVHHKAVLGTLIVMGRMGKTKVGDMTVGKVRFTSYFDQYLTLCATSKLVCAVTRTEFNDIVTMLETAGFISLARAKEERARRVTLLVQESDVLQAINEVDFLKKWIEDSIRT